MQMSFRAVLLALGISGVVLAVVGLTACSVTPATPAVIAPVAGTMEMEHGESQVQVILTTPAIVGSNSITVQLRDATTGQPPHHASVRVAVAEKKQTQPAKDDHVATTQSSHADVSGDHGTAKKDDHANEQKDTHGIPQVASHESGQKDTPGIPQVASHESGQKDTPGIPQVASHESGQMDTHGIAQVVAPADEKKDSHQADAKNPSHTEGDAGHAGESLSAGKTSGDYVGQVMFPNSGEWLLTVSYEIEGKEDMAMYAVNATRSAETWLVLSGFLGVNLAVIAVAGITKRKALKK